MDISGIPSQYRADDTLSGAWEDGKAEAERAHAYSDAYGGEFPAEPTSIPVTYRSDANAVEAFRDGYAVQAQELTGDGS